MDVDVIDQIFFWFFFLLLRSVPLFRGVCRLSVVLYMLYVLCVSLLVYWWKKSSGSKRWCRRGVCSRDLASSEVMRPRLFLPRLLLLPFQ